MSKESVICASDTCEVEFTKTTHNQKYCSTLCCKKATNATLKKMYHKNVAIKKGKVRICDKCNVTKLSRYNPNDYCASCETAMRETTTDKVSNLLASVAWL